MGFEGADYRGKPVIAIINTWSDINPCHTHFKQRVEDVKRGVWSAGGFPVELPAMSLSEPFQKPTTMLYRNLLAMETEELLRSYPVDGAVLMGGCDKTTPGLLMGASSMDLPSLFMPAGPMLRGHWGGTTLGSGSDTWKYWADLRAGNITQQDWQEIENGIARSPGHCMTMGTASTMTSATEALGFTLAGAASIPAPDSRHAQMATLSGKRIVDMVWEDLRPSDFLGEASFRNAVVSVLANLRPSGAFLMEDFYYAGGLRALLKRLGGMIDGTCKTVTGRSLGENIADATVYNDEVIRPLDRPLVARGGLAVLHGNLAPDGAVIKPAAMEPHLLRHTGPAVVFENYDDMAARIDLPELDIDETSVIVLKSAGPQGAPGMPEWGQLPIPKKLLQKGVRDMVRISDARMSGTSYGACVLHVAPESHIGGPLALVRSGDLITLDVEARQLQLQVSDEELAARRAAWQPPAPRFSRGYGAIYLKPIRQANEGCDFDFLEARPEGAVAGEPEIH